MRRSAWSQISAFAAPCEQRLPGRRRCSKAGRRCSIPLLRSKVLRRSVPLLLIVNMARDVLMLIINMSWHAAIISRFLGVFRRGSLDQRLDEEIGVHLDLLADEFERRGMTPHEARRAARRSFGGTEQIKEEHRTRRAFTAVHDVSRDIRHALRVLRRQPGFAIVA